MCAVSMESVAILRSRPTSEERKLSTMRDRGTLVRLIMTYNSSAQLVAMFLSDIHLRIDLGNSNDSTFFAVFLPDLKFKLILVYRSSVVF